MTCNKNGIPFDPEKPMITSGVRLGTPAATTRGFGTSEFTLVGDLITEVLDGLAASNSGDNSAMEAKVRGRIHDLCGRFPIYHGAPLAAAAD
jgi:glycine hydroxymethyltransferase